MSTPSPIQDDDQPVRSDSVTAYRVEDDSVLYDAVRDQVFAVNPLARAIWDCCDGTMPLTAIGRKMAQRYDVSPQLAMERARQIISDFHQRKLLHANPDAAEARETIQYVTFGTHQVALRTDAPEVARALRRLFGAMLGDGSGETVGTLGAYALGEQYHVQGSRVVHVDRGSLHEAVRSLKHEVVLRLIEARPDLVWLHAGAVARADEALLFVGEWGSGKSTMVATLYRAGWQYLSDDMVPYDPVAQRVTAFPLTIAYREHEGEPLAKEDVPGLSKTYVDLQENRVQQSPLPVRAIVFPTFQSDAPADLNAFSAAEAAVALVRQCQNGNEHRGDAVEAICELTSHVPSYRLQYNHETNLTRLLGTIGAPTGE